MFCHGKAATHQKGNGIPHAFVIDTNGKIVWHGHPMDDLESVVKKYLPKQDDEKTKS